MRCQERPLSICAPIHAAALRRNPACGPDDWCFLEWIRVVIQRAIRRTCRSGVTTCDWGEQCEPIGGHTVGHD